MAHYQQNEFVRITKAILPEYFSGVRVLEVGSWSLHGSVRDYFSQCDYVGADIAAGPGVDLVCQGQDIESPTNTFDVVMSCECFEHNRFWLETFVNMIRVLKPGGLLILTCAAPGRIEHGTNRRQAESSLTAMSGFADYYRNLGEFDFRQRISLEDHFECCGFAVPRYYNDLYFLGVKRVPNLRTGKCDHVRRALNAAKQISLSPGASSSDRTKRLLLSSTSRVLERLIGSRLFHDTTFFVHRLAMRYQLPRE